MTMCNVNDHDLAFVYCLNCGGAIELECRRCGEVSDFGDPPMVPAEEMCNCAHPKRMIEGDEDAALAPAQPAAGAGAEENRT